MILIEKRDPWKRETRVKNAKKNPIKWRQENRQKHISTVNYIWFTIKKNALTSSLHRRRRRRRRQQ